jgi:hypothetical protein
MTNYNIVFLAALIPILLIGIQSASAQASDYSTGYNDGQSQAQADRNNGFHLGSICSNNSNQYCEGYISGYLDQWFSHFPTSTHTTTIIRESHRGERGGCHGDNCTKIPPTPPVPVPPVPPTPPKDNGTK